MVIPQFYFQVTVAFLVEIYSFWIFGTNCNTYDIIWLQAQFEEGFDNFV